MSPPSRDLVEQQLETTIADDTLAGAGRSKTFMKFHVEQTTGNPSDRLEEYTADRRGEPIG